VFLITIINKSFHYLLEKLVKKSYKKSTAYIFTKKQNKTKQNKNHVLGFYV